jgi:predicted metalloprotease with PDZ domain
MRSQLIGVQPYLQRLGELLTRVYRTPGRFRQSIAESSFDAWDSLYKPEANSPNAGISYYMKGALTALALDLTMRSLNRDVSLDDVVKELWRRYGARDIGVPEDGFERLATEIAGSSLADFFAAAVRGTDDLDMSTLFGAHGVRLETRAAAGSADTGGTPAASDEVTPSLGATFRGRDGSLELVTVFEGGPAQSAGLSPGDVLIALGGLKVHERNIANRLSRCEIGERLHASAFRGDELIEVEIELTMPRQDTCFLELDESASADALSRRKAWLGE